MIYQNRIKKLQEQLKKSSLDAFVLVCMDGSRYAPDLVYLTEVAMEGYWMVVSQDSWWVLTNRLLDGTFRDMGVKDANLRIKMNFKGELEALVKENGWKAVGFDSEVASYGLGKYFVEKGFQDKPHFLTPLRVVKDNHEITKIRKSCQITARSMKFIGTKMKPGAKESDLAFMIEHFMRKEGASGVSFDLIVGAGPNSAIPHYRTGDRKLKAGDAVVVDIGCIYQNYCSDMTRTFHVGKKPGELFKKIHGIVARSQKAGIEKTRAGLMGRDVDAASRVIIEKEGYGKEFTHGTGHGVGIEIHEAPWVRASSENILKPGMIITVEPGIYLDGKLGVRIEDTLLVTEKGYEVLTKAN